MKMKSTGCFWKLKDFEHPLVNIQQKWNNGHNVFDKAASFVKMSWVLLAWQYFMEMQSYSASLALFPSLVASCIQSFAMTNAGMFLAGC